MKSAIKTISLIVIYLLAHCYISAQTLVDSRRTSYYRFIYSINQNQAKKIHNKGLDCIDQTFFYHLVDSIPLDSTFTQLLPQGDYLSVWVADNQLHYQFRSYSDIDLTLHNNYADLSFTLRDKEGVSIRNAKVKYRNKLIRFDQQTQSYLLPKKQIKGLIEVEYNGFTSFYYIDNIAGKVSISRKILYSFPLKYITIPVKLILWLPYDIYKSIRYHGLYGLPYYITKPFKDIYFSIDNGYPQGFVDKLANTFDRERKWGYGYTVYSKPKYRPQDTVKVKTFITNKKGKPYNKKLNVYYYKKGYKLLGEAQHINKGNYSFSFAISDTLDLKLDSHIRLQFGPNSWTQLSSGSFYFEDYELKDIKYTFRCSNTNFYPGDTIKLTAKGEDMNGYIITDGKVEIIVKPGTKQGEFKDELTFLPDTLWTFQSPLKSGEETEVIIPDSVFNLINSDYQVKANFINSSNEQTVKNISFNYWFKKDEIHINKEIDSLKIEYLSQNKSINQRAYIQHKDINNNSLKEYWIDLPFKLKIEPNVNYYTVLSNDLVQNFSLENYQPSLSFATSRNLKTINISTINPDKIPFKYYIYRKNSEILRGFSNNLDTTIKANNQHNYFLSVQYEWAGKSFSQNYNIPLLKKQLNIQVEQPFSIYPGQKAEIKIKATDYKGNPVSNIDITAMGLTRKFNFSPPALPIFEKNKKERTLRNNYNDQGNILFGQSRSSALNFDLWNIRMNLDSIEFFKFCYPKEGFYQTYLPEVDSLTQLAPFVFKDGELQQAHIIWIDNSIVYSSIATNNPPYSFKCTDGYHNISIRTNKYDISIDSIKIENGHKNIISIDIDNYHQARITPTTEEFNDNEKGLLRASFVRFEPKYSEMAFTTQYNDYNILSTPMSKTYKKSVIVGPFHRLGLLNYTCIKTWSFDYESGYEYSINGDVLKMKSDKHIYTLTNRKLNNNSQIPDLTDEYWTLRKIKKLEEESKNKTIARKVWFTNPYSTKKGNTSLTCKFNQKKRDYILLYTLLFNDDADLVRIYNGRQRVFHDLIEGYYRLVLVFNNNQCFEKDSILLQKGGQHFLKITEPDTLDTNKNLNFLTELIAQKREISKKGDNTEEKIKESVKNNYKPSPEYKNLISGYVQDSNGEPIPGATIILDGTNHGTITNIDGYYQLNVPSGTPLIKVMFIGFEPQEIRVGLDNHSQVKLNYELCALDEVVVVGYGVQKKYSLTGSVTTVESALQGKIAGVNTINSVASAGAPLNLRIRGVSNISADKQPLYIIDGVPYEGDLSKINPSQIADMQILKDAAATSIYGAKAANGVIILSLQSNTVIPFKKVTIEKSIPLLLPENNKSLRTNFNDVAYWQPTVITDNNGEASFEVTFPDDITSWDTHILAMSSKGQTAINSNNIKAFLPLSANLNTPRYATEGDNLTLLGKTINYMPDSIKTNRMFKIKNNSQESASGWVNKFTLDSFNITIPKTDTITIEYSVLSDEFKDGEQRQIPVLPLGSVDNIGEFTVLQSDTTITWQIDSSIEADLYIESNPLNILQHEAKALRGYNYLCNEQKASKLIGLLSEKQICTATGNDFKYNKEVNQLISKLSKSRNTENLWGWWSDNSTSYWVSNHVIKALALAKTQGFNVKIDNQDLAQHLVLALKWDKSFHQNIEILNALIQVDSTSNYKSHANGLLEKCHSFNDSVSVYLLRQKMGLKDDIEPLINKHKSTLFGSIYWGQDGYHLFSNDIIQTIKMYQLIKLNGEHNEILSNIRNWFFEQRNQNGWTNTYYSSNLLTTMLPDLLPIGLKNNNSSIIVNWQNHSEKIDELPYESSVTSDFITINKKGDQPLFVGYNQSIYNPNPEPKADYFELKTRLLLNGEEVEKLIAGKEYQMQITINVKHKADYLMLEVPMPAGCSFANKKQYGFMESYREYYKEKVNLYFESLSPGTYTKLIDIIPRFNGKLNLNPAKIEQMYFPIFYGRNKLKQVVISETK